MELLTVDFFGQSERYIRLHADLEKGWRDLGKKWGFDNQGWLPYQESKFRCRIRLTANADAKWETRKTFPEIALESEIGGNPVLISGGHLELLAKMAQPWKATNNPSRNPSIYASEEVLFSHNSLDGEISYSLQLWLVFRGPSKMFVPDVYEWGDGFAWVGGRPESNRRRF
jgi:hypothetical protein